MACIVYLPSVLLRPRNLEIRLQLAPSISNPFSRLTSKRLRRMPFLPERVKAVLYA